MSFPSPFYLDVHGGEHEIKRTHTPTHAIIKKQGRTKKKLYVHVYTLNFYECMPNYGAWLIVL